MIELTAGAQTRLNDYLTELRRVLQECPSVDPVDVERDVQDHIQAALAGAETPVDETHLDRVLRSLGVPRDWVQDIGQPWYRYPQRVGRELYDLGAEFVQRFAGGPESFRLPYLSLAVLSIGCCVAATAPRDEEVATVLIVSVSAAFVLARAAVALHDRRPSTSQMWLLGPALLVVYVPLIISLLCWPIIAGGVATAILADEVRHADDTHRSFQKATEALYQRQTDLASMYQGEALTLAMERDPLLANAKRDVKFTRSRAASTNPAVFRPSWARKVHPIWLAGFATAAVTGLWWLLLGLLAWGRPHWIEAFFRPFASRFRGRGGLLLSVVGLVLLGTGLVFGLG